MEALRVGLAIPLRGPGGIFGPSSEKVAQLAVDQLNDGQGILGRQVELEVIDAGGSPEQVCDAVMTQVRNQRIDAVVGWHISSVRAHLAPVLASHRVPYVYTSLHEGARGEGVMCSGETPAQQVVPGLQWMRRELGIRRWAVVGADYIWPRRTAAAVRDFASGAGLEIVGETFVKYGCSNFRQVIADLWASPAQGVVLLLVGQDAVRFNREFAAAGLCERLTRFTPLMEENMLLASGAVATSNLFVAAAYFNTMATESAMAFTESYLHRFGAEAPALNNAAESCYEGVLALAAAVHKTGSLDPSQLLTSIEAGISYHGPRGRVELRSGSSRQQVHVARAEGYEFDVLEALSPQQTET